MFIIWEFALRLPSFSVSTYTLRVNEFLYIKFLTQRADLIDHRFCLQTKHETDESIARNETAAAL